MFPLDRKAAPLLRGWVRRLREAGVRFHVQHRWLGWNDDGALRFATPDGEIVRACAARPCSRSAAAAGRELGSDGAWEAWLRERGIDVAPLQPSNCGFDIGWSEHFAARHAGAPLKPVVASWHDENGHEQSLQGECVVTATGIEGSLVYALSATLRDEIARRRRGVAASGPGARAATSARLRRELSKPRAGRSLSEHLRRQAGLDGVKAALVHEVLDPSRRGDAGAIVASDQALAVASAARAPDCRSDQQCGRRTAGSDSTSA